MSNAQDHRRPLRAQRAARAGFSALLSAAMAFGGLAGTPVMAPAVQAAGPIGAGFTVSPADLAFILKQIKIAEAHVATTTSATGPCASLLGPGPNQIPAQTGEILALGLRTVDGTCNRLGAGQENFGAADQVFPRLTTPVFRAAEAVPDGFPGAGSPTSYTQTGANDFVFDSQPRQISNLIVDQTSNNPAAVAAAGPAAQECTTLPTSTEPGVPEGCEYKTLSIPNITTDVGLSPPFNGLFTIFGQFFDHGLDKITNGGNGTVFVPLKADDPLVAGADHILGNDDDLPPGQQFMVLTRGQIAPNTVHDAVNTDTPFVDQSQTYTSHPSHQVFTREYINNSAGRPVSTGAFLASPDGGLPTWAMVKAQVATLLGLKLSDSDVADMPMIAADPYGKFIPGPARGLPRYVTTTGLVEGNRVSGGVAPPSNVIRIHTAFLNDIAHAANPRDSFGTMLIPDADSDAGNPVDATHYDDEFLNLHFICGDGRCNENIALTAVHQVFHSEHDRLVADIKATLLADTSGVTTLADWQTPLGAPDGVNAPWNGERLFQAARFVTEMEYQHLVFEEFARKVAPAINAFGGLAGVQSNADVAIQAEFAHAVYRFGHSMLTETIARTDAVTGNTSDIPLLDGFLNPQSYNPPANHQTSQEAAGSIFMGMSDQVGNEIDEFVTDTLRNHLLGLPLDLPSINMARARSEGIPSLNNVRKQIFAATNDPQLTPYISWVDFGTKLKHPQSLINFVAAYGKHPTILAATTTAEKRAAARAIVAPEGTDVQPADSAEFMYSALCDPTPAPVDPVCTADWRDVNGVSQTGLDDVDLWVGGLAEQTNQFGGMLGSTFNYVFELQLTALQNTDRFYYLERAKGMNLLAQLEQNSFSELVMRNTNAHTLKADAFSTADCKFEFTRLTYPADAGSFITGAGSVNDDPASTCDENRLLTRVLTNGEIQYRVSNSVDKFVNGVQVNAQGVYNATDLADRMRGGIDADTFYGRVGNDIIEGNGGPDFVLGGLGNDIITDSAGDDVLKGGPGNDAINAGPGLDIVMSGDGSDFTDGGQNSNETIAGAGNDFVLGGVGAGSVIGDSGNDWIQGGADGDFLVGDSNSIFFEDHNLPGHDVLIGGNQDDKYVGEGGDDIVVAGNGREVYIGSAGYDWMTGFADPLPQDASLKVAIVGPLISDQFKEVEALSGGNANDILRGDDLVPTAVNPAAVGSVGCDALDAAGVARIAGLNSLIPASLLTVPSAPIIAAAATQHCLLSGRVWGDGNILIGGPGSDTLRGDGANDILDGDKVLSVRLSIRNASNVEIGSTDLMEHAALSGNFGTGTVGMSLETAVFAGLVDPGNIVIVREILSPTPPAADCAAAKPVNCDTAVFFGPRANYSITSNLNTVTVTQTGPNVVGQAVSDGTDTLRNIERLQFSDQAIVLGGAPATVPGAPTIGTAVAGVAGGVISATANWSAPASNGGSPITGYVVKAQRMSASGAVLSTTTSTVQPGTSRSLAMTLPRTGTYRFMVRAINAIGNSAWSARSNLVAGR